MDFGVLGLDGFVDSSKQRSSTTSASDGQNKTESLGSGSCASLKQGRRSGSGQDHDFMRATKVQRSNGGGDFNLSRAMPLNQNTHSLLRSDTLISNIDTSCQQERMLSFSLAKPESASTLVSKDCGFIERTTPDCSVFTLYQPNSSVHNKASGSYGNGSMNSTSMHGSFNGISKGPFTPSQWMELEHQALIYKYITANVPVPSNLLLPIKKALYPYGLTISSSGSFSPCSLGWGAFHLGYHGNTNDPEPGRCRRTDGKKWRCSRDAVNEQKYCERHINRGRHRSRKPVEGQNGHAAASTTNKKVALPMTTTSVISSSGSAAMNSLAIMQQQFKILQPPAANASTDAVTTRAQDQRGASTIPYAISAKADESMFTISKPDILVEGSSRPEFGLVSCDSLLNPSHGSSYMDAKSYDSFLNFNNQDSQVRQFIDWPQLSMSIPLASSDFSSSTASPNRDNLALSPLRLSSDIGEPCPKQASWIPISWGTSSGGPLGEVLTSTGNAVLCKGSSSPTGVLQKATFTSLSNSSSGSSPRAETKMNKNDIGVGLCDDVLISPIISWD